MRIKRILAVTMMFAMVTVFSTTNAFAAERKYEIQSSNAIIIPYWDNAELIDATVSFEDGEYTGYIKANSDVTKISMTVVLKVKNSNGTYSEVSRTSKTSNSNIAYKSDTYDFVKGKTYKLTVYGTVYVDSDYENVEESIIVTY